MIAHKGSEGWREQRLAGEQDDVGHQGQQEQEQHQTDDLRCDVVQARNRRRKVQRDDPFAAVGADQVSRDQAGKQDEDKINSGVDVRVGRS